MGPSIRRNPWVIGSITLFLIFLVPLTAFSQKASIREVLVKGSAGDWKVSFRVEDCFTEKMNEAIQTGIPTTFTFHLQLYQVKSWWRDRKVASFEFQHTIQYYPIRGEYQVTFGETGASRVTQNYEEAKRWMAGVRDAGVKPSSSEYSAGALTYLRIKAELETVKLPLHLEYLFFFLSLWNFETDWHVESLSP